MISEELRDRFWGPGGYRDGDDPAKRVVVDGEHYLICEETGQLRFRGFGGSRFHIEFFDGRRATTTNLMHQGTVPDRYRDLYPDNARFLAADEAAETGGGS
ncbi:hypothetical protein ACFWYW_57555 [Nonomuraea sp. NPDC059023]|uniref:hypothetical protein n=1 Tax=unclassified Nonomuraea TaxID=2593643 RepID=UPI00368011DA